MSGRRDVPGCAAASSDIPSSGLFVHILAGFIAGLTLNLFERSHTSLSLHAVRETLPCNGEQTIKHQFAIELDTIRVWRAYKSDCRATPVVERIDSDYPRQGVQMVRIRKTV